MLVVQVPLVCAEWAMEPHCMVKACHLNSAFIPSESMWQQGSVKKCHVACIRDDAGIQNWVIGQCAISTQPHSLARGLNARAVNWFAIGISQVDWAWMVVPITDLFFVRFHAGLEVRKSFRIRKTKRSRNLPVKARFEGMKTCLQVEDDFTVLNGNDATSGKASSITQTIYLIQDWRSWVARTQKIRVKRMDMSCVFIDCA